MKRNKLYSRVIEHLTSVEQNLAAFKKEQKPEYLHQLRLDIKKIRAVFAFSSMIYKVKFNAKSLKPLFQNAGKIREMHINVDLLMEDPESPDSLIPLLKEKENKLVREFLQDDAFYHNQIAEFRKQLSLPEKLPSKKKIKKYFKREQKKTASMLNDIDSHGLHEYRIKIKKLLYAFEALPDKLQSKIDLNTSKISKQQKKLGKWHDTYAAVEFYSNEDFSLQSSEYIQMLKEREKREFNALIESLTGDYT